MKHRIACSILAVMGAAAFAQAPAWALEATAADPVEVHEFGEPAVEAAPTLGTAPALESTAAASSVMADDPLARATCPAGNACFWKQTGYDGDRKMADASVALDDWYLGAYDRSVKNRFGNRRVTIKDVDFNVIDCVDAGGQDANLPGAAAIFRIGATGSDC